MQPPNPPLLSPSQPHLVPWPWLLPVPRCQTDKNHVEHPLPHGGLVNRKGTWRIIPGLRYVVNNHGDRCCPLTGDVGPFPNGRYVWLINRGDQKPLTSTEMILSSQGFDLLHLTSMRKKPGTECQILQNVCKASRK